MASKVTVNLALLAVVLVSLALRLFGGVSGWAQDAFLLAMIPLLTAWLRIDKAWNYREIALLLGGSSCASE